MSTITFIIGMLILGLLTLISAFVIAGAVTVSGKGKNADEPVLRQPEMRYFTDFDTADYLGITVDELAALREKELLDGVYVTVLSTDPNGTEEYYDVDSTGREVIRTRPATVETVRCIYSKELLDARMNEIMKDGKTINLR